MMTLKERMYIHVCKMLVVLQTAIEKKLIEGGFCVP